MDEELRDAVRSIHRRLDEIAEQVASIGTWVGWTACLVIVMFMASLPSDDRPLVGAILAAVGIASMLYRLVRWGWRRMRRADE